MAFLIDTNVLSELRKGPKADPKVRKWAVATASHRHCVSVLTLGEIRRGIDRLRGKDKTRAAALDLWLEKLRTEFGRDILPVTDEVAEQWGRMTAGVSLPVTDSLIAATALVHGLTVVTRNEDDFERCGVGVVNPFL